MESMTVRQNVIKSKGHTLGLYHQQKTALSGVNVKRWICEDNIRTFAFGHILTKSKTEDNDTDNASSPISSAQYRQYQPRPIHGMPFGKPNYLL